MRPSSLLTGMPPQFEVRTEAEKWQGAFKQAQGVIREQGQVMSAALTNNESLWYTNKALRERNKVLTELSARIERERNEFKRQLDSIPTDLQERASLQLENTMLKEQNAALRTEMAASLFPELDTDKRREALERVRAQEAELQATGIVPTAEEIARADHARDQGSQFHYALGGGPLPPVSAIDAEEHRLGCICKSSARGHDPGCPRIATGQSQRET